MTNTGPATDGNHSIFWDDLAEDLADPEFLRQYVVESVRIATLDRIVNALDSARLAEGISKAEVARSINVEPAVVRRLLSGTRGNPTVGTVSEVAAALGFRLTIEPIPPAEKRVVTQPLRAGQPGNARKLARELGELRSAGREAVPA